MRIVGTLRKSGHPTQGTQCTEIILVCYRRSDRFLVVVLAAYRQMHAQEHPVLSDVEEKNFDRAFEHFRPSAPQLLRTS